jgi:C4-dicarboxylate-specific signal transduction histidine kinase
VQHLVASPEGEVLFLSNNFVLLGTYIIGAFANYSLERHTRIDFLQKRTIEAEKNKVNDQRVAIEQQAHKLSRAIASLKETQSRLVNSEKLASLGELTAGIAHEIKNPLNFVTNFSELNMELINDFEAEAAAGNTEEAIRLAKDIKENLQKIAYHSNRADSIVKNMLQHSRKGTGQKQPTDINALIDEYFRLSYQGVRAKDKDFNTAIKVELDETIESINVVPQDIGRVLLNMFTNAFYSVNQKKKQAGKAYEPCVTVSTQKETGSIAIRIRDNGVGITQKAMTKIFQPFFTTKPTGEGVGLGLSLSHDIITKGHGGMMNVESGEGEFAEFIIHLPS